MKTLVADIGGTNSRLAIAITSRQDKEITLKNIHKFRNSDFNNFDEVIKRYLSISDERSISRMCIAAAGIISDTTVEMSNLNWKITVPSLQKTAKIDEVFIINDLQAQGYALDFIEPNDLEELIEGSYSKGPNDTKLVCGMGTGFNVAIAYQTAFGTFVPASEYGHARTTTANEKQKMILKKLEENSSFVSYENILAGPGLNRLDQVLNQRKDRTPSDILSAAQEGDLKAKEVGSELAGFAGQAFGDFALMNMALGGVYLIGGVARAIMPYLKEENFKQNFYDRGNFSEIMKKISVYLILDDYAALKGCANYSTILSGE
ncbi:MAG: ROK family protein [Paracoccaceae bacterium]|nr:ROK family protein [Paracoccaceae bacterium]